MHAQRFTALALAVALTVQPMALSAQSAEEDGGTSRWRRWALAGAGAVALGGLATFTDQAGEQARTGVCDTTGCVVAVGSLLGAGLGYLLGSELDKSAVRRAREGPTIDVELAAVDLAEGVTGLLDAERGLFALGREGVDFVDASLVRRALFEGFPARAGALLMDGALLVLASSSEVVGIPLPEPPEEPARLLDTGAASLLGLGDADVAVGEPGRLRRMAVGGSALAPSLLEEATAATAGLPAALALGAGGSAVWTLEDSSLVARNPSSLAALGQVSLPGRGVAVTLAGPMALVSMGNQGVAVVDVSDPRAPVAGEVLTGMDFAYDAAALDGRIYVAAGAQGLFVFDATGDRPTPLGVIRATDFAGDLLVKDGRLYILDRAAGRLYRL